jgi:hypothetical protein
MPTSSEGQARNNIEIASDLVIKFAHAIAGPDEHTWQHEEENEDDVQ